jgi:uncharacterized protein YqhQ
MSGVAYGGQALIEGVLVRGRRAVAVALRRPDGQIVWATEPLGGRLREGRWSRLPLLRGLVVLYDTLVVGTRWLLRSADLQASAQGVELGRGSVAAALVVSLAAGIGLFFLLPLATASAALGGADATVQHLAEGLVRVVVFLGYLALIALAPDVRRVFQYHGAEHMAIHALEHGDALTVERVRNYPTAHPRCGTEFLAVVVILSILVFSLVGRQEPLIMVGSRILLVPVVAALAYEVLRWGARRRTNPLVALLFWPGILVQRITARPPTDAMVEVAIVSLEEAMAADGVPLPPGSRSLPRLPLATGEGEAPEVTP